MKPVAHVLKNDNVWVVKAGGDVPAWAISTPSFMMLSDAGDNVCAWDGMHGRIYAKEGDTIVHGPDGLLLQEKTEK